jgi:hypothetical protein
MLLARERGCGCRIWARKLARHFDPVAAEGRGEVETMVASSCDRGDESVDTGRSVVNGEEESSVRELEMEHCE